MCCLRFAGVPLLVEFWQFGHLQRRHLLAVAIVGFAPARSAWYCASEIPVCTIPGGIPRAGEATGSDVDGFWTLHQGPSASKAGGGDIFLIAYCPWRWVGDIAFGESWGNVPIGGEWWAFVATGGERGYDTGENAGQDASGWCICAASASCWATFTWSSWAATALAWSSCWIFICSSCCCRWACCCCDCTIFTWISRCCWATVICSPWWCCAILACWSWISCCWINFACCNCISWTATAAFAWWNWISCWAIRALCIDSSVTKGVETPDPNLVIAPEWDGSCVLHQGPSTSPVRWCGRCLNVSMVGSLWHNPSAGDFISAGSLPGICWRGSCTIENKKIKRSPN